MTTIYTRLATLGFAEWLKKKYQGRNLKLCDELTEDSAERTSINALAFRWLREEKGIYAYVTPYKDHAADNNDPIEFKSNVTTKGKYYGSIFISEPLAEIACLEKAEEILTTNTQTTWPKINYTNSAE